MSMFHNIVDAWAEAADAEITAGYEHRLETPTALTVVAMPVGMEIEGATLHEFVRRLRIQVVVMAPLGAADDVWDTAEELANAAGTVSIAHCIRLSATATPERSSGLMTITINSEWRY